MIPTNEQLSKWFDLSGTASIERKSPNSLTLTFPVGGYQTMSIHCETPIGECRAWVCMNGAKLFDCPVVRMPSDEKSALAKWEEQFRNIKIKLEKIITDINQALK